MVAVPFSELDAASRSDAESWGVDRNFGVLLSTWLKLPKSGLDPRLAHHREAVIEFL